MDHLIYLDKNKIAEDVLNFEELKFKYNFINTPWDDRSRKSKIGIVSLLVAIFLATMTLVVINFAMHYKNIGSIRNTSIMEEISCYKVKMDDYQFVARIHSASTKDLLCVGAVVSKTSVLTSGVCVQFGVIRVYLGSHKDSLCKKGFPINAIEPVYHDGVVSKRLVLLSSYENLAHCSKPIPIGNVLDWDAKVDVIGRPNHIGRSLSRQFITLDLVRCSIQAGDLLVQRGRLFGIATTSTSVQHSDRNQLACFADLNIVKRELKELDEDIDIERAGNESQRSVKL